MKKITFLLILKSTFLFASLASADWIKDQEELISNYQSVDNLRDIPLSKPEPGLKKGKYESETEFNARLKNTRNKNVKRFYVEYEANFNLPNDREEVDFPYNPFERIDISGDTRQAFQAKKFDLQWPATNITLSIDKEYLQEISADIVFIKIIEIDISDPDSFGSDYDQMYNRQTLIKGSVVAVGLYDKVNSVTVGIFSPRHDKFYHSYNGLVENLAEDNIAENVKLSFVIPIYVAQPTYPRRAQSHGKKGYAVIEFIITKTGGVRDLKLVEEWPEGWGFGRAALKAAQELKYNPYVIDGQVQELSGVLYKYSFQIAK